MSWVRLDDGFTNHPKIVELSDAEFRAWIRLLCYCARVEDPTVDGATRREVAGLNARRIARFTDLGLLDQTGSSYEVHDWSTYRKKDNTNASRQARWRSRRNGVTAPLQPGVTEAVTSGLNNASETVTSLARDQARRPVPEPEPEPEEQRQASKSLANGIPVARPEGLPAAKELIAVKLMAAVPDLDRGVLNHYASELPQSSLAKILESVLFHPTPVGGGYVVNALKSELKERSVA